MSAALDYLVKARPDAVGHYFAFLKACGRHLDPKTRNLISVITKVDAQTERGFRQYLGRALREGCTPMEVLDALLMAFPTLGLAKIVWAVDIILAMNLPDFRPEALSGQGEWHDLGATRGIGPNQTDAGFEVRLPGGERRPGRRSWPPGGPPPPAASAPRVGSRPGRGVPPPAAPRASPAHLLAVRAAAGVQGWDARAVVGVPRPEPEQQRSEPGPAAGAAALDRPGSAVEHRGGLLHAVALHVDEHERGPLLGCERREGGQHLVAPLVVGRHVRGVDRRGRGGRAPVALLVQNFVALSV